ncbi:hypothetical protein NIES2107_71820 (plasmid) [Nostoc carneum NIES-2107]|nr:hypothetical protein NIES2107_71820 [Nostoc carneum NIES-2107]
MPMAVTLIIWLGFSLTLDFDSLLVRQVNTRGIHTMPKNKTFTMRFSEDIRNQLGAIAGQKDISLAQVVREALREYLKANNVTTINIKG